MVFKFSDTHLKLLDDSDSRASKESSKTALSSNKPTWTWCQITNSSKLKKSTNQDSQRLLVQFIEISPKIFSDDIKAQEKEINISTSSISHETRSQLNAELQMRPSNFSDATQRLMVTTDI